MNPLPLYQRIAQLLGSIGRCRNTANHEWETRHEALLREICRNYLPSGSGFDSGTVLRDISTPDKLVFSTSFHHMNDTGMYDGWTDHDVIVKPSLAFGFDLRITGRNRDGIKDYIADIFHEVLTLRIDNEGKHVPDQPVL